MGGCGDFPLGEPRVMNVDLLGDISCISRLVKSRRMLLEPDEQFDGCVNGSNIAAIEIQLRISLKDVLRMDHRRTS